MSPLVSIGVAVRNEARHLEQALRSLLDQDYAPLEIIISDNASTDETQQICEAVAASDERVRYHRQPQDIGATHNFAKVLDFARGDYFMWAAGHDLWTSNLVSSCVSLLQRHPAAAIAFGTSRWIDAQGNDLPRCSGWTDTRGMDPVERFFTVLWGNMHPVYGLMRTAWLREAGAMGDCVGADLVLLCKLAWKGDLLHAPDATWLRREIRPAESHQQRMARYRQAFVRTRMPWLDRHFPLLRLPVALLGTVRNAPIGWLERLGVCAALVATFPSRYLAGKRRSST
jgi:glycosyltransferase involved in cell wall biosynthesis